MSDDDARDYLLQQLKAEPLSEPKKLKFEAGYREVSWKNNCVAIGLSSGFLEPLESTSIYLVQIAIMKLIALLPASEQHSHECDEFNRQMANEYEKIRDFLILHYHVTERDDSPFWHHCRTMSVPDSLTEKIQAYQELGHLPSYRQGLFLEPSWLAVMHGQGLAISPQAQVKLPRDNPQLIAMLQRYRQQVAAAVNTMPSHSRFLSMTDKTEPEAHMGLYGGRNGR